MVSRLCVALDLVPDVSGLRLLNKLPADLSDIEVAEFAFQRRRAQTGLDRLAPCLQKVVGFSCVLNSGADFHVHSFAADSERDVLTAFWGLCERASIVRWSEREAPMQSVLLRSLQLGVVALQFEAFPEALHERLAGPGVEYTALNDVARLSGLPAFDEANQERAWQYLLAGDWNGLRVQAELRAVATCVLDLRYRLMSRQLMLDEYRMQERALRGSLAESEAPHLQAFESAWLPVQSALR